ncbi:MAG: hypothetical protein P8X42_06420 [Calditrichaceae bacterium]
MSRKYLYFKLFRDINDTIESEIISELEIGSYLYEFEIIENVFQLYQNSELNLLIKRSSQLQNLLTKSLPPHGCRHGYFWSGYHFPDITKILSGCGLLEECIAFNKNTDSMPGFKNDPLIQLNRRFEIYNWQVCHFRSFQYYFEKSSIIRALYNSETDIDWAFDHLWEKQKSIEKIENAGDFEQNETKNTYPAKNYLAQCKRKNLKNENYRWLRALINYLNPKQDGILYIPFAGEIRTITEATLSGNVISASDKNPLRLSFIEAGGQINESNLPQLNRAIGDIISQAKMLLTGNVSIQADLFVNSIEKEFEAFWEIEKNRINELQIRALPIEVVKFLATLRFLIESKNISKSKPVNIFLLNGLINLADYLVHKKQPGDVIGLYQKELRTLYLDLYAFHKIRQLNQVRSLLNNVYLQNTFKSNSIQDKNISAVCCFYPGIFENKNNKNEETIVNILNLNQKGARMDNPGYGLKLNTVEDKQWWIDEITANGKLFTLMGGYAKNILTRMLGKLRNSEAASFFKLWLNGYYFLNECSRVLTDNGKACIIINNSFLKLDNEFEEINTLEVFRELIDKYSESLKLRVYRTLKKPSQDKKFGRTEYYHILLLKKE